MAGRWGFCGPTYVSQSPNVDDEDAMNCYCEQSGSPNAKTPIALFHTPGRRVFATLGETAVPSLFTFNGRTFAAVSNLYELNAGGGVTNWGSLGATPTRPTMMCANQNQLVILNNGALFVLTLVGAITGLTIAAGGSGYAINDTGTIGGSGTGATYIVTSIGPNGAVTGYNITAEGSGYNVSPGVPTSATRGNGVGLTLSILTVANGGLSTPNVTVAAGGGGSSYAIGDTGNVNGAGTGATYTVTAAAGGVVSAVSITAPGQNYVVANNIATTRTSGTGTGLLLDVAAVLNGQIATTGNVGGGQGYNVGDQGSINGTGSTYTVTAISAGGIVTAYTFTPGANNVVSQNIGTTLLSGTGSGLSFNITAVANNNLYAVPQSSFNNLLISQIGFIDGYVIATIQNSHTWQQSNLEDATVWQGLNIETLSYFPDNITSMICDHREIWFFSGKKAVVYNNAGAGFPAFIPIQGAFLETGAVATFATAQLDNTIFWLAQDERGQLIANRANGYGAQRISTHATELAWQQYATVADAIAWTYQEYGHTFYMLYFPTANATWGYDTATGYWHKRGYWLTENGTYIADRAMSHTLAFNMHLVGDWASGTIYQLSSNFYTDAGNTIRGYRRSPTNAKENKWVYYRQFEIDVEVGLSPQPPLLDGNGNPRPAQLMLRWSDDAGKTWSNTYYLSVGSTGDYNARVIKRMLGRGRKRVWEVSWTDPIPWRFADAYVEANPQVN